MNGIQGIRQSALGFWSARNARERSLLALAGAVVLVGLIYLLLIDPALSARDDLRQRLPVLRQQAAELQALTREASSAGTRAAAPAPAVTRESLEASLARRALKAQEINVGGELVRLRFEAASFAALVEWLSEAHRSMRLAVAEAAVETKAEAGNQADTVSATLTLRQERGPQQ